MTRLGYWSALDLACAAARRRYASSARNPAVRRAAIAAARSYLEQARAARLLELELAAPWVPELEAARPA